MREFCSWLESYNLDAFQAAFGRDAEDYSPGELAGILAWGLGYVDYSKASVVADLVAYVGSGPGPRALEVEAYLPDSSVEALQQGLDNAVANGEEWTRGLPYDRVEDIADGDFGAMMAYALGFIDYEVLAREYPGRR